MGGGVGRIQEACGRSDAKSCPTVGLFSVRTSTASMCHKAMYTRGEGVRCVLPMQVWPRDTQYALLVVV